MPLGQMLKEPCKTFPDVLILVLMDMPLGQVSL